MGKSKRNVEIVILKSTQIRLRHNGDHRNKISQFTVHWLYHLRGV